MEFVLQEEITFSLPPSLPVSVTVSVSLPPSLSLFFCFFLPLLTYIFIFGILDWKSAATSHSEHRRVKRNWGSAKGAEPHLPEHGDRPPGSSQSGKAHLTSSSPCSMCLLNACIRNSENARTYKKYLPPLAGMARKQAKQLIIMKGQREIKEKGNVLQGCRGESTPGRLHRESGI